MGPLHIFLFIFFIFFLSKITVITLGQGTKDLVFEPLFLLWTNNMSFITSWVDDRSSIDRAQHWPIHLQAICITWEKELAISPFHLLITAHFWHLVSVGSNCCNTINTFLNSFSINFGLLKKFSKQAVQNSRSWSSVSWRTNSSPRPRLNSGVCLPS